MKKSSSDCVPSSSKSFTMISFHAMLFLCVSMYLGMYTDIHLQTRSWFGLSTPSTSTSPTPSSSSPTTLVLPSPRSSPWFTSVLRSMDDLDTATDTLHTWRRQYFTPFSHCIMSHSTVNSTSSPSTHQLSATHHDDYIHINETGNDMNVWQKRIDTFQHGIEMAQPNIQMEKNDGMTSQHKMVISHVTQLCNDVIEHLSSFPLQLSSDLTSITSHLTSTHHIITSSIHSFTWTHDRDMVENMIHTWRGKGSYVKYQYLKHTFIAQMMTLLQPWKILFDRQHHSIPAPLTSPYMTTDDEMIVRPILSHLTTQFHHYVQQFIDHVIPHITSDIHHPINSYEYENILMILYLSHELFPRQQHPITHVVLSSYINHITTLNHTRIRMIHTFDEMMKKQDTSHLSSQQHIQTILDEMDYIQQIRMITQEIATTTSIIIPITNDDDDTELAAPAYMIWKKILIQAQDDVTNIQTQLEHLQALKQDLSNHLTSHHTHIQSFTNRITSLRDVINTHIQHMNGTLDTIMSYATWSEKYVIHAQQHVDLSHAWMIQQQIWYTTWMKQLDSSITSLEQLLSRYQHRISILHHIHDTCLSMWQFVINPIDIAIHNAQKTLPQYDTQWINHIEMAEQILFQQQQHFDTTTKTLQEKIQQTEVEWKHAQKQHDVSLTASLSSQLSIFREQLQDVKIEQETLKIASKTLQEKKEDVAHHGESQQSHSSTSNTHRSHSKTV